MRLNNCFYLRSTVIIGPFVFLVIGLNLYIGTNKDLFFSSALKKKKKLTRVPYVQLLKLQVLKLF